MSKEFPPTYVEGFHYKEKVEKVPYKRLGQTDLIVSQLGIGGSVLGGYYKDEVVFNNAKECVVEALKSGLNYIDTSPFYGEGRSETHFGKILKDVPRQSFYLATKVGRYENNLATGFDFSLKRILDEFENSLERLGVNYVDIIQIHDFEFCEDSNQILTEALVAVDTIRKSGKAKYIGITGYPLNKFHDVLDNTDIKVDCVLSYCRNILTDNELQDHMSYFKGKDLGVINASPTGMGILNNSGPPDWHPAHQHIKDRCALAAEFCKQNDVELGKLSVYHNVQAHGIDVTLLGFVNMKILNINLELLFEGLSSKEKQVYDDIRLKFFSGPSENWEGVETGQRKEALKLKAANK